MISNLLFDTKYLIFRADLFDEPAEMTEIKQLQIDLSVFGLNDEDRLQMKDLRIVKLPRFNIDEQHQISYSLVDLLFAYLFDLRINQWESNALTEVMIGKLAPSLSGLVRYQNTKEAMCTAIRRSLCYSLYRQFGLALRVAKDLSALVKKGKFSRIIQSNTFVLRSFYSSSLFVDSSKALQHFRTRVCLPVQSIIFGQLLLMDSVR